MKFSSKLPLFVLLFSGLSITTLHSQIEDRVEFRLQVDNIKKAKGCLMIAVYDSAEKFLGEGAIHTLEIPVSLKGSMSIPLSNLKYGLYSISMFHDQNDNKVLDTGLFGIPTEPYGFSRNLMGLFGPPSFEKASFEFNAQHTSQVIRLN